MSLTKMRAKQAERRAHDLAAAAAEERLRRVADNYQAQVIYMCSEIAAALSLPIQTPAGTVQSVRDLAKIAGVTPNAGHKPRGEATSA